MNAFLTSIHYREVNTKNGSQLDLLIFLTNMPLLKPV